MQFKALLKAAAACIAIYLLLKFCFWLLSPFMLSLFISILIEPAVIMLMEKLHISRRLSILAALLIFCCLSFLTAYFLLFNIYNEAMGIIKDAPNIYDNLRLFLHKYYTFLKDNFNITYENQNAGVFSDNNILEELIKVFAYLKDFVLKFLYSLPDILMYISFSMIAAFFISRDRKPLLNFFKKALPGGVLNVAFKLNNTIMNIIKTELLLVVISTLQTIIGLLLLGVDYAVLLGFISGIMDILPLIGPGMLFIPWFLYSMINGRYLFAVSLLLLYIIIAVTRQILETRMISGKLGLHPLIILISMYLGLRFFGILGMIFGPLAAAMLKLVYIESMS